MTDLFAYQAPAACQRHSPTSVAAGEAIEAHRGRLQRLVLEYLKSTGGATDEALQVALGLEGSTERPRRRELQLAGLIKDSGRTALTRSGRKAVVWVVA